jgi:AAA family ATP:ADP antiporter
MTVANPAFSALVARLPRRTFVSWTFRFFMANLVVFFLLLQAADAQQNVWVGRAFYVWSAVFNLFVPSVFWSFMIDIFSRDQVKRLFGVISAAGTAGALTGSLLTATFATIVPPMYLLLLSAALLELAVFSVRRLSELSGRLRDTPRADEAEQPIGGSVLAGIGHAFGSPYMAGTSLYMLLFTVLLTFLYFQQAEIVDASIADRAVRTAYFAEVNLLTNVLALVLQLFVTAATLRVLGLALTLALVPAVSVVGFALLGLVPVTAVVVWFQALRRAGDFAITRPAREVIFTVLPREDRYKTKSFIDTFVYRAGDQVGAWSYAAMAGLGLGIVGTAWVAVPLSLVWVANGLWLGRRQERMAAASGSAPPPASAATVGPPVAPTPALD